jgi:ankyrin repeat protein
MGYCCCRTSSSCSCGSSRAAMAAAVQNVDFLSIVALARSHGMDVVNVRASGLYKLAPLHMAVRQAKLDYARALIQCGADVHARDWSNWTPLMYTARFAPRTLRTPADRDAHLAYLGIARLLLLSGADVNARYSFGTALHICADSNNLELARMLVERGADINEQRSLSRKSPLHVAAMRRSMDVAELLLIAGARVNCVDEHGLTPLHYAAKFGSAHFISLLLEYGAEASVQSSPHLPPKSPKS